MEWKSDFIESFVSQGRELGLELGHVEARRKDILKVLSVRHLHPTDEQCAQVTASSDRDQLDRWFDRSLTVETAAEVFED